MTRRQAGLSRSWSVGSGRIAQPCPPRAIEHRIRTRRLLGAPRADSARGTSPCLSMSDAIDCPPNVLETGQFPRLPPRTSPPTIAIPPTNPVSVRDPASPGSPVRCPCGLAIRLAFRDSSVRPRLLRTTYPARHAPSGVCTPRTAADAERRSRPLRGPRERCARRRREPQRRRATSRRDERYLSRPRRGAK